MSRERNPDPARVHREAVAADRRNYETAAEHDAGVERRTREAIADEAKRN